jgi:hypothetical protein
LAVDGAVFYDVKVIPQNSISQDATVTITLTNAVFTSQDNEVAYWDGANWIVVPCIFTSPDMLTVTVPVSALTGTPFAVWQTVASNEFPTLLIVLAISIAVVVTVALIFYSRKGKNVQSINAAT